MSLAERLLRTATKAGVTIATAESCTGGLIAGRLTEHAGSSAVMDRGWVVYDNAAKEALLGVRHASLESEGAVSERVAREMAEGALARSDAGIAVAATGIAGPGGSEHKPEGRVCFGLARSGGPTHVETVEFGAPGRARVRKAATEHALALLSAALD